MPIYEAQILKQRTDINAAIVGGWPLLRTRHELQRDSCWEPAEKVEMIDTVLRGWTAPPIYIIEHPELTDDVPEGEEHVFDGAHKLESVFEFMDNKFALRKTSSSCPEIQEHDGKKFNELPNEIKGRIRKYVFTVNIVDKETAADPDKLQTLWQRLNRAGKPINSYELNIPTTGPLLERVIKPSMPRFLKTALFGAAESKRGKLEQRMMFIMAICYGVQGKTYSQNKFVDAWIETFGPTTEIRKDTVVARTEELLDVLVRISKMLEDLADLNTFHDAGGALMLRDAHSQTELPIVLGCLARRFPRIELFRNKKAEISATLKAELFSKDPTVLMNEAGAPARNGSYLKKILERVGGMVDGFAGIVAQPRCFTEKEKKAKLKEQNGLCAGCGEKIQKHQKYEGDHIVPWSEGGATSAENLQVLHVHCHQKKTVEGSA